MPWMRVAVGVGVSAMVAGIAGMFLWIDDGSHYFDLAVAVALAGLLTLVACVLTMVFGSSHGSQDDAFRRGRSMGYDAGFLEGHRTARPVVVPMHSVDPDPEVPVSDIDHAAESWTVPVTMPVWHRDAWDRVATGDRMAAWISARRVPLMVGVLSLTLVCVLAVTALARPPVPAEAFAQPSGTPLSKTVPSSQTTPDLVTKGRPVHVEAPVAAVAGGSAVVPGVAGGSAVVPVVAGGPTIVPAVVGVSAVVPAVAAGVVASPIGASYSLPGHTTLPDVVPAPVNEPAVVLPVSTPAVVPVVPAPVEPLTAAEQTAADAAAAAKLTAANAAAAAKLTAANAAAAAAETARVAAAAAETTRLKAAADAYAVAHPGG
jgi:hypothetical protein